MPSTRTKAVSCAGKKVHATMISAQATVRWYIERGSSAATMNAYRCRRCGGIHVGHAPGSSGKRRR